MSLQQAVEMRKANLPEKALNILENLLASDPSSADINYQIAWTYDFMGKEREAVSYYEAALACGLSGQDRRGAFLGLGSTLRCLGEYKKSLEIFDSGLGEFPDDRPMKVFRALTQFNLGKAGEAVGELLLELLDTTADPSIKSYDKALRFYSDKLTQVWL